MRKEWETPKLTVLVRNKSEEKVLGNCKTSSGVDGEGTYNNYCYVENCVDGCNIIGAS